MDTDDLLLRFEEWSGWIQEGVDEDKGTVEAVNTLMVVVGIHPFKSLYIEPLQIERYRQLS